MSRQLSLILALALTIVASETAAHPAAQGSMEVTVYPEYVDVRIRAANEECFLAEVFREGSTRHDLNGIYKSHGLYLLRHVFVIADGKPLKGGARRRFAIGGSVRNWQHGLQTPFSAPSRRNVTRNDHHSTDCAE
jgi:hypothetical protein